MKHHTSKGVRLLSLLLSLCLTAQLGASAWAAESSYQEGMLSPEAAASESAQEPDQSREEYEQPDDQPEAAEAEASEQAEPESTEPSEAGDESQKEQAEEQAEPAEKSADAPEHKSQSEPEPEPEPDDKADESAAEAEPDVDSPEFWEEFREEYAEDGDYLKRYEAYQEEGVKRAFEDDDDIPGTIEALSEEELEAMAAANSTKSPFTGKTYTHAASKKGKTVTLGIDVSYFQGNIDWKKVKAAGVKFAILRCGRTRVHSFSIGKDEKFEEYVKGAHDAGIKIGVYYFSQATSVKEAQQEAKKTLEYINSHRSWITLPVFLDIETGKLGGKAYRINKVSRSQGTKNVLAYSKIIKDAGYEVGYYGNPNDLADMCDVSQLTGCICWLARWSTSTTYSSPYDYWQYSSSGKVNGISGRVDCNFRYSGKSEAETEVPVPEDSGKPAQVTGLKVTNQGDNFLDLKWNAVSTAERYKVEGKADGGSFKELAVSVGNTCKLTGLKSGTAYTLRVKAVNAKGTGSASASVTASTTGNLAAQPAPQPEPEPEPEPQPVKRTDLAAPKLLSAENVNGGVRVKWEKVNEAELYRVYRKSKGGQWTVLVDTTSLSYLDKSAKNGTWYRYTVRCINASDKSNAGSYDKTGATVTYYAAPTLTKAVYTGKGVSLSYNKVAGVKCYRVFRKGSSGSWKGVATTTAASVVDNSAKKGQVYRYTVRGVTEDGKKYLTGYDSEGRTLFAVTAPKLSTAKNSKAGTIAVKWPKTGGAQGYELRWVLGKVTQKKTVDGGNKTGASIGGLTKGKTYLVSVRCFRKAGDKLWYSAWSGAKKVKVSK